MNDLTFRLVERPHSAEETLAWIEHDDGRRRRATAEEVALFAALEASRFQSIERKEKKK